MEVRKGYKQTEVGVIPEDWDVQPLGALTDTKRPISYGIVQTGPNITNGVKCLRVLDIENGKINKNNLITTTEEISSAYKRTILRTGDLVTPLRGKVGDIGLIDKDLAGSNLTRGVALIALQSSFSPSFFKQFISFSQTRNRLEQSMNGSALQEIPIATLRSFKVTFPPTLAEQEAIAEALSDADALIESLETLLAKKRQVKQGAMSELLSGKKRLTGFDGEWVEKTLGEIGEITGAGVDKKIRPNESPVRLVNYLDVYHKDFIYSEHLNHWVSAPSAQLKRCAVRTGDIFFTPSSEMPYDIAVSAVAMEDIPDAAYSYHVVRLRLNEDNDWSLAFRTYIFKTYYFLSQAETMCEGSGKRYVITLRRFRELKVYYPIDLKEQTAIAEILSDMDAEIRTLEEKLSKARGVKAGMMSALLGGKVRLV